MTGPVRSGKSALAARLAAATGREVLYFATAAADPTDAEWSARLARHAAERPAEWQTLESATLSLREQLAVLDEMTPESVLLVDALGTWLATRIASHAQLLADEYLAAQTRLESEASAFVDALLAASAEVIVVAEQVGWDVVPAVPSARVFRDVLGRACARLAVRADRALLVIAGYALDLRALDAAP